MNNNTWHTFPQCKQTFTLGESKLVTISYNIVLHDTASASLVTRVLIDGAEYKEFKCTTGCYIYHNNSSCQTIPLGKGEHVVEVQYRTNGNMSNMDVRNSDYQCAIFTITC